LIYAETNFTYWDSKQQKTTMKKDLLFLDFLVLSHLSHPSFLDFLMKILAIKYPGAKTFFIVFKNTRQVLKDWEIIKTAKEDC